MTRYTVEVNAKVWIAVEAASKIEARKAAKDRIDKECEGRRGWDFESDTTIALGVGDVDENNAVKDSSITVYAYHDDDRVSFGD